MKIKIKKTKPKTRAKKSPGWHALSLEELVHWAHAWEFQQKNPDNVFREKETVTALRFGCGKSTINRRNDALIKAKVAQRLHKNERGKNQWFVESTLCISVAPPECVLRLAKDAAEVRAAKSPEPKAGTAQGCINTSDEPYPKAVHITTTNIPLNIQSVSIEGNHIGTVCNSSGVEPKAGTDGTRINSGDEPYPKVGTDTEVTKIKRQLRDAENKLLRLWREYGKAEPISRVQSDRVAELKANLAALGDVQ